MATAPQRVADMLFRRDMLGPSFGNLATSLVSIVLVEKVCLEHLLPLMIPSIEAMEAAVGRLPFAILGSITVTGLGFWGVGFILALPAFFQVQQWKIQVNRSLDTQALFQALPLITFNSWFGAILGSVLFYVFLPEASYDFRNLPSITTVARDVVVWLLVEEVMFFHVHRALHENKRLYATIHKLHHTWTAPVSFVAIYCHPLEHIASNIAPMVLGPVLCGSHTAAVTVFFFLGFVHTTAVHCGYWLCDDNGMHDEHHRKFTVNYGVMGLMDTWYGTFRLPPGAVRSERAAPVGAKKGD